MQLANKIPFDDRLCHSAQVDDLSPLLVRDYLRRVGSRITLAEAEAMPFEQLCWNMQILGGTTETVHPKNVGVLFFWAYPRAIAASIRLSERTGIDTEDNEG